MPDHRDLSRRGSRRASAALILLAVAASGCGRDDGVTSAGTSVPVMPASSAPVTLAPSAVAPAKPTPAEVSMPAAPTGDFYAIPDPLPAGPPGSPIWTERVAAPKSALAWRILYHSRTIHDEDIAVSGLVVAPDATPPEGGFPVIAYAHGTTGLADQCAPSKAERPLAAGDAAAGDLPLPPFWEDGYVVVATDYEGLGTPGRHPYIVGGSEGRGVLDSIRAARALAQAHAGDRTVVVGISQGGHAALFTGELADTYAPDAGLLGVVALAPGAELAQAAMLLLGDESVVGFAVAIGAGFDAAYPDVRLEDILTPQALADIDVVDTGCIDDILATYAGPVEETLRLEGLMQPPWPALLDENTPGRARTSVPIFVGQGEADALVVPELTDALVVRLCAIGDEVTYRRYPGASHGGVVESARDDVLGWIEDRFAGRTTATAGGDCPG